MAEALTMLVSFRQGSFFRKHNFEAPTTASNNENSVNNNDNTNTWRSYEQIIIDSLHNNVKSRISRFRVWRVYVWKIRGNTTLLMSSHLLYVLHTPATFSFKINTTNIKVPIVGIDRSRYPFVRVVRVRSVFEKLLTLVSDMFRHQVPNWLVFVTLVVRKFRLHL